MDDEQSYLYCNCGDISASDRLQLVKSWFFSFIFLQSSSQLSSLTLGIAINLSDWLRFGARSRSSPGAPSLVEGNQDVLLIDTGIV